MKIVVVADEKIAQEFFEKKRTENADIIHYPNLDAIAVKPGVVFYLPDEGSMLSSWQNVKNFNCPVIVNSVTCTLKNLPGNCVRINAWPGFIGRDIIELVARDNNKRFVEDTFNALGWPFRFVADVPGMIAAKVIAMIINEAWFALEDEIGSREDMDIAMKLGTNYPYGPFEWCQKIGPKNIVRLLQHLAINDNRYAPSPLLLKETVT